MTDQSQLSSRAIIGSYFARMDVNPGQAWVNAISELFLSDQEAENYPFLGQTPAMREFQGGRLAKRLQVFNTRIVNRHFEATLEVAAKDRRRDKTQQLMTRIEELADRSVSHWAELLSQLIAGGESLPAGYDGVPFFSTSHSEGQSGVQSNSISVDISEFPASFHGLPSVPSLEEVQHAVGKGITKICSLLDDQGEPMNEGARRFLVLAPLPLVLPMQAAFNAENIKALPSNFNPAAAGFEVDVQFNPRLNWTDKFALFRTDGNTKALIRQSETDIEAKLLGEGSDFEFNNDAWQFGIDAWRNVGFGHWQRACLVRMV